MANSLDRLLKPRSIAVFGGVQAAEVVRQSQQMGFAGEIWPVHPKHETILGLKAYRSVADLPAGPDAAFIGVNRYLTLDIVRQLREIGTGVAVCYASGFLEAGADDADGARLQEELVAIAGDMPIIGPNCYGLINYCDGALLWPDQHGGRRLGADERGVAIITQSSNIAINMTMQRRGLPIAHVMTAGNQAQTGLPDMAMALIEDERVTALGLHIEAFQSAAKFEALAARARTLNKPIVAMKVGRSAQARAATISHTASLAGSDAASDAFLRRLGIARVNSIASFLETLKLLHVHGPLSGNTLCSMSCSGGEASVMADAAEGRSVHFPPLDPRHRESVKSTLGPLVAVANPLDYHTFIWNNEPALTETFTAMVAGGFALSCLVLDFPRKDRCSDVDWWSTVRGFENALKTNAARGAIIASLPENLPEEYMDGLMRAGIAPLCGITEAMDAAEAAAFIGAAWSEPPAAPVAGPAAKATTEPHVLDEAQAKAILRSWGLPVPDGRRCSGEDEAVLAANAIGYPVTVKALGIAHKSEHDAVRLNLGNAHEVRAAAGALARLGSGLYVEQMVTGVVAELIVGITDDPQFGPALTIGSGGVLVELLQDTQTLLLPATRGEIEAALRKLRMFPLLDGYRGRARGDVAAAIEAIAGIADFAVANKDSIAELDINPLLVRASGKGVGIADALISARGEL
ncbi:acetate--CoA ligase family protein [Phyllobacterium sp. 21LDTY02-6]|uniref:acetate--CoA ligase family protein n=1 Tax=Phyllobacterium sp. 21LDTY02-6 TaxID=2944903 RepID=UPI00201FDF36|nr:acetate--CoA ligase family protein [Phyllobacterium sp. 21LDTY02-6]MCO4316447.1 acetate--CoA ligase family protein [Phyllobacterium sp. 21LDTY02-6]